MTQLPSIQQLENFVIYGKVRNFTAAAREANITQSAFSFQMKKLEELIGIQLIARSNRGSDLTEIGEDFFQRVQKIIDELSGCIYDIKRINGHKITLAVGTLMSLGDVLMNQHVEYFQEHNMNFMINVYNLEAHELWKQLENDKLDIISTFFMPQLDMDKYEKRFFCKEKMVYYAPNLGIDGSKINMDVIKNYDLAQYSPYYLMNAIIKDFFISYGIAPTVKTWLSTPYAIMHYCQQNEAGSILSKRLLNAMHIQSGYYEIMPQFELECYLLYKRNNPKYKIMKIFIEHIQEFYKNKL
ncbi:LysR family transcriptional regulator [Pectinatus sottacetonis]|uniref:LysR family transcriptional regulator n=1 Tax=Pectinatus sottacetonis TaxID=1002795 RepID=UPI0018C728C2|nr:LysR family transcriptional regulator [Pectinatus sottacetonis]